MISDYTLEVIRQVKQNLVLNNDTNEFEIQGKYFKDIEPDYVLKFSNYSSAMNFIIETLMKDLS